MSQTGKLWRGQLRWLCARYTRERGGASDGGTDVTPVREGARPDGSPGGDMAWRRRARRGAWLFLACALALQLLGCTELASVFGPQGSPSPPAGGRALLAPVAAPRPAATVEPPKLRQLPSPARPALEEAQATARNLAATTRPPRDLYELASALRLDAAPVPRQARDEPVVYRVGDSDTFWIADQVQRSYYQTQARLALLTPHVYWWLEEGQAVRIEDLELSARKFEEHIYPTVRRLFGEEWQPGTDADPRLSVFLGRLPGVAGYFSSADEYPTAVNPHTNERELIYMNVSILPPGSSRFEATLAHEFEHMVHWWQRQQDETWVNEGSAELASWLAGYPPSAPRAFLQRPETQLTSWALLEEGPVVSAHYGAAFLFMHYFADHYGGYDRLREFLAVRQPGIAAVDAYLARLGVGVGFNDVFADWVIANLINADATGDGRFAYHGQDVKVQRVETAQIGQWEEHRTPQYAARYVELPVDRGDVRLRLEASDVTPLLATTAHSGRAVWWSNRGDEMASTLTRSVDLRAVTQASLEFWTWFDIERDYDYGYVMASTDGGHTWTTLPSQHSTTANPNGANYGHAYTGISGGGREPVWELERVDLTPFAGREMLLRFALVSDDAYNAPGWVLDDVRIPELAFADDAEQVDPEWVANGFARVVPLVPQRFTLRLVVERERTEVQELSLDEGGLDTVLPIGGARRAVLVIAPVAPSTTESASYRYRVDAGR